MNTAFLLITIFFVIVSVAMVLIILVQRPQGGGLAGAFGGAGGAGTETVFGGRVGDALTWATVVAFVLYLGIAISLNKIDSDAATAVVADEQEQGMFDPSPIDTSPQAPTPVRIDPPTITPTEPGDDPVAAPGAAPESPEG